MIARLQLEGDGQFSASIEADLDPSIDSMPVRVRIDWHHLGIAAVAVETIEQAGNILDHQIPIHHSKI